MRYCHVLSVNNIFYVIYCHASLSLSLHCPFICVTVSFIVTKVSNFLSYIDQYFP